MAHADIEIDGLTVVIGNNNQGKSTLGKVLYSMFHSLSKMVEGVYDARVDFVRRATFLSQLRSHVVRRFFKPEDFVDASALSVEEIEKRLTAISDSHFSPAGRLRYSLNSERMPNIDIQQEARSIYEVKEKARSIPDSVLEYDIVTNELNEYFNGQFLPNFRDFNEMSFVEINVFNENVRMEWNSDNIGGGVKVIPVVGAWFIGSPYVLDAVAQFNRVGRRGVMLDNIHRELVSMLRQKSAGDVVARRVVDNELASISELFESQFNSGTSFVVNSIGELCLNIPQMKRPLPVANLSMGLKTFTVLRLMLETNTLRKGDVIILDEPENHLHPGNQVLFAQIVVILQRIYDLTVLLTTHSPYFLQAIELYSRQYAKRNDVSGNLKVYRAKTIDSLERVEFDDITGITSEMYRKFAAAMRELDHLRTEVMEEEREFENDGV